MSVNHYIWEAQELFLLFSDELVYGNMKSNGSDHKYELLQSWYYIILFLHLIKHTNS